MLAAQMAQQPLLKTTNLIHANLVQIPLGTGIDHTDDLGIGQQG